MTLYSHAQCCRLEVCGSATLHLRQRECAARSSSDDRREHRPWLHHGECTAKVGSLCLEGVTVERAIKISCITGAIAMSDVLIRDF